MEFQIRKSSNNKHYFVLVANNGEDLCCSEMYESLQGCKGGIAAIQKGFHQGDVRVAGEESETKSWWKVW